MRDLRNRLQDILEAIAQIEVEQRKGKAAFDASSLIQVWMVHHLMIIGEAVRSIDPAIRQRYPSVPWRQIAGMRNILVHDYFRINEAVALVEFGKTCESNTAWSAEREGFRFILAGDLNTQPESEIGSGGYVISTLTASIWCLLTTSRSRCDRLARSSTHPCVDRAMVDSRYRDG